MGKVWKFKFVGALYDLNPQRGSVNYGNCCSHFSADRLKLREIKWLPLKGHLCYRCGPCQGGAMSGLGVRSV